MRPRTRRSRILAVATTFAVLAVTPPALAGSAVPTPGEGEPSPPLAWTTHGEAISATEGIVFGRFNPRNHRTVVRFEYGPTRSYGHVAPKYVEEEWFGEEVDEEEEILECLRPGTVYHYRIVARSKVGIARGQDKTFRTPGRHRRDRHEDCNG